MRRPWLRLLAVALALLLVDAGLWAWGTHALQATFSRWRERMQRDGWTVQAATGSTGGFPFGASLALTGVRIEGGAQVMPGGVAWQASRVVISVSLAHPLTLSVSPDGEQQLQFANAPGMVFHADRMEALLALGADRRVGASLQAEALVGGIVGSRHPQDVRVDAITVRYSERPAQAGSMQADLTLRARQIELPDIGRWPMGAVVSEAGAQLSAHLPRLSGIGPRAEAATAWRDAGGTIGLQDALLKWGPITLTGDATLTLDKRLQPSGHGIAVLSGGAEAFDALVSAGVLREGVGATMKAVLGAMAQLPGGNGVRLPFTLRDNTLSVGPIPIARLHDVVW